jgi:hypothetical protein
MKKFLLLAVLNFTCLINAQTTVNYPQRVANYDTFFTDGGGQFDQNADEFGMWANFNAKQSVAWRSFTSDGTITGTPKTMSIGDSFTTTLSATQASYGVIGLALLSSPTSKTTWADRNNNYAVQVNLNGNNGANSPWEVVSNGGTINTSTIGGSTTYADFVFKFTLTSSTTMEVSINNGAALFNVTVNNQNITGYAVYFADDWNGSANANIFWKPTTAYTTGSTLSTKSFNTSTKNVLYPNPSTDNFVLDQNAKSIDIYSTTGKQVLSFKGDFNSGHHFEISNLPQSIYFVKIDNGLGQENVLKLVKK